MNKLVARFADGRMIKGTTFDFSPAKEHFHITELSPQPEANPTAICTKDLKALFFVKDYAGNPRHVEDKELSLIHI